MTPNAVTDMLHTVLVSPRAGPSTHLRWVEPPLDQDDDKDFMNSDCDSETSHTLSGGRSESHTIIGDRESERPTPATPGDGGKIRSSREYMLEHTTPRSSMETLHSQSLHLS